MPATFTEAILTANRLNSLESPGPKIGEGKARLRRKGLKHGLTGGKVALPVADAAAMVPPLAKAIQEADDADDIAESSMRSSAPKPIHNNALKRYWLRFEPSVPLTPA